MDHHTPPPAAPDRAHWTPARQRIFLHALLDTGSVTAAARAAGMNRSSAQRLRRRLAGTPFDRTWAMALVEHARRLADPFGSAASTPPTRGPAAASPPPVRGAAAARAPRG